MADKIKVSHPLVVLHGDEMAQVAFEQILERFGPLFHPRGIVVAGVASFFGSGFATGSQLHSTTARRPAVQRADLGAGNRRRTTTTCATRSRHSGWPSYRF